MQPLQEAPRTFYWFNKPKAKFIRNVDIDDCDVSEDNDDEGIEVEDLDVCIVGTSVRACYNCRKTRHFAKDCKRSRTITFQKDLDIKVLNKEADAKKKANTLARDIRALEKETDEILLTNLEERVF